MRVIVWVFISTLLAAMIVHGLEISARDSARPEASANFEIQPGLIDNEDRGGREPSQYKR